MKTLLLFAFATLLATLAGAVNECDPSYIGLASDPDGAGPCCLDIELLEGGSLYFLAPITGCLDGVTSLSFRIPNWPDRPDNPGGVVLYEWYSDHVAGDLATGITLSWDEPIILNHHWLVGRADLLPLEEDWLGSNLILTPEQVSIEGPSDCVQEASPTSFEINSDGGEYCECDWQGCDWPGDYIDAILWPENIFPPDGSEVYGDFSLDFDVWSFDCDSSDGRDYEGEILLDGDLVFTFEGNGLEHWSVPISTSEFDLGEEFEVLLKLRSYYYMGGILLDQTYLNYSYAATHAASRSWSTLKIRY